MKWSSAFEQANRVRDPGVERAATELAGIAAFAPAADDARCACCVDGATRDRGFSLMEALAVIAVIAVLATLALPSYLDKIIRDQVVEALPLADIAKAPIAAAWAASQPLPAHNAAADLPTPDKIVNCVVSAVTG